MILSLTLGSATMPLLLATLCSLAAVSSAFVPNAGFSVVGAKPLSAGTMGTSEVYEAATQCLEEECSVDAVDMLLSQLRKQETELSKKGRIVDYERLAPRVRPVDLGVVPCCPIRTRILTRR